MIELKLALRNLKRDFTIYSLMILSSAVFIALIVGFQSTIGSGSLGQMLSAENLSEKRQFFKMILIAIAITQYVILVFFINSYYRIINKNRIRELALYRIIGYTRGSIRKIILAESLLVFIIILPVAYLIAFGLNHLIIVFVNYYLSIDIALTAELSISSFIYSSIVLLVILLVNTIKTYRNTLSIDLEQALKEGAIQKVVKATPKYYVFANLIIGLILIILMSFLSLQVSYTLRFGIIIIAIIYAIGLFLVINAFATGYRYLITQKYQQHGFNRLQVAESNFQLNKSKVVTLSSIVLIMMSIGALLLSQAITITLNQSIPKADYSLDTFSYDMSNQLEIDTWIENGMNYGFGNLAIYPIELADEIGVINQPTPYEVEVSSDYAKQFDMEIGDKIRLETAHNAYNFTVTSITNEKATRPTTFVPIDDFSDENIYKRYSNLLAKTSIVETEIEAGNLNIKQITTGEYQEPDAYLGTPIMALSEYNQYLQLIGQEPETLSADQIIVDGNVEQTSTQYQVVKYSHQALNVIVFADSTFENIISNEPDNYTSYSDYYLNASDSTNRKRISEELRSIDEIQFLGITDLDQIRQETLGNTAFVLLIALYLAIIFIITNFTTVTISCLSHAIENKQLYLKLEQMGIKSGEKNKYISRFISTISIFPLIVGVISGVIATKFAINLVLTDRGVNFTAISLLFLILILYTIIYIIFINIIKYVYKKIISS